jgi:hypothetical protein
MVDTGKVREMMRVRRVTWSQIGAAIGLNAGHARRKFRGTGYVPLTPGQADRLASVLRTPLRFLLPDFGPPRWEVILWSQTDRLEECHALLREARVCVTLTQGLESYLQPEAMVEWTAQDWLKTPDWNQRRRETAIYVAQQRRAREEGRFTHLVIAPAALFQNHVVHSQGWGEMVCQTVAHYDAETVVGLVEDWRNFTRVVSESLPPAFAAWDKVMIADRCMVMIRDARANSHYFV